MKKISMFFYAAAVVGFYISLALLYTSTSSVMGISLLCMSILLLGMGVTAHWRSGCTSWFTDENQTCVASDAQVRVSC